MAGYCLITGATSGIGMEFARVLAVNGNNLILVARNQTHLENAAYELTTAYEGIDARIYSTDLSVPGAPKKLYDDIKADGLEVEILINNAGVGHLNAFLDSDFNVQQNLINLNITALTELLHLFGKDMKARGHGKILNVSSVAALSTGPYMATYYASKAYVLSLSHAVGQELKGSGVTVTALCPGPTNTNFARNAGMDNSILYNRHGSKSSTQVAVKGYKAMMRGQNVKYYGWITYLYNIGARLLPRNLCGKIAKKMNTEQISQ